MGNLINEAGLPDTETVRLLRSKFTSEAAIGSDGDLLRSDAFPQFWFTTPYAAPLDGLSIIDSLFCDKLDVGMKAYMKKILNSSLSDAAKRDVIRLEFPKHPMLVDMTRAHRIYCSVVRDSSLPDAMKQELISPIETRLHVTCSLL